MIFVAPIISIALLFAGNYLIPDYYTNERIVFALISIFGPALLLFSLKLKEKECIEYVFSCIIFGIICHILGLRFDIFYRMEGYCCLGLFGTVIILYLVKFRQIEKIEKIVWVINLIACIAMAVLVYKNAEQVDKDRAEQRNKFEQQCTQEANKNYNLCKLKNINDAYNVYICNNQKENYIRSCSVSAIDWRDTEIKIAFNTINLMAGTLAIGTAIVLDTYPAIGAYLSRLLMDGKDAKFGGIRWTQDLVLKAGLYYVPYHKDDKNNIFVAICFIVVCFIFVDLVHSSLWTLVYWIYIMYERIVSFFKNG